jgi:putative transposase
MVKNRKLSRAISDLGWRSFRDMLSAKSDKYGRDFLIIFRWEPTSQWCSCCGNIGGKKALNIREWECLFCGTFHDRDINAAVNIKVAGGQSETSKNGHGGQHKTSVKEASSREASTQPKIVQLSLFDLPVITVRPGRWGCQSRWSPQYRKMIWSSILPIFSIRRFWGRSVRI